MFLPYASDFLVDEATAALTGSVFASNVIDQYLTGVSMTAGVESTGDVDFIGAATLMELDDEDRVVLTILGFLTVPSEDFDTTAFADDEAVILWHDNQKWWGDAEYFTSLEAAQARYDEFDREYMETLPCEDCGSEDQASCTCDHDETVGPIPVGTHVRVNTCSGVALTVQSYRPDGRMVVRMVGDDRDWDVDPADAETLPEDEFCSECGQIGCGYGNI